jgi:hypothetical protein
MAANPRKQSSKKKPSQVTKKSDGSKGIAAVAPSVLGALPHQPGITPGAVDVTGVVPEDVHVDPDITEGHPGYEESGGSELHPSR